MGILNIGKTVGEGAARGIGRGATRLGSSKGGLLAVGALAGVAGLLSSVGPSAKDATLEAAFGDKNADRYFTGRSLDTRFLVGSMMGGVGGGILQATAPGDLMATNPAVGLAGGITGGLGGGLAGAALGGFAGSSAIGALKELVEGTKAAPFMAGASKLGAGTMGAIVGGAIGASAVLGRMIKGNQQFYAESPYMPSSAVASQLNATGDIVLGMHNSRRGY